MRALISLLRNTKHIGLNTVYSIEQKKSKEAFLKFTRNLKRLRRLFSLAILLADMEMVNSGG